MDDRALYATGPDPAQEVKTALERGKTIDDLMGLTMRPDKCEIFATDLRHRRRAEELLGEFVEHRECVHRFKLLGIWYNTTKRNFCQETADLSSKLSTILGRIRYAMTNTSRKIHFIREMILPAIAWMGAWNRPTLKLTSITRTMIEKTINAYIGERSTALGAILRVGWKLDPEYQLDWAAFRYLLKSANNDRPPSISHPRMREVLAKYACEIRDDGILKFQNSVFDCKWDGELALQQTIIPIWEAHQFTRDLRGLKKAVSVHDVGDLRNRSLNLTAHRKIAANQTHTDTTRAALLATPAGQRISKMFPDHQYKCWCGEDLPQRGHLLWDCPSLATERHQANIKQPKESLSLGSPPPEALQR